MAAQPISFSDPSEPIAEWREALGVLYPELRRRAHLVMRGERSGHTLQPTGLVHEALLRLMGEQPGDFSDNRDFLQRASRHMTTVLIDYARRRTAMKRGGGAEVLPLMDIDAASRPALERLIAVGEALDRLREVDARAERVAVLRYLMDLSEQEVAEVLGISVRTVERDWIFARAWLRRELAARARQ